MKITNDYYMNIFWEYAPIDIFVDDLIFDSQNDNSSEEELLKEEKFYF